MFGHSQRQYWNESLALGTPILLVCSFVGGGMAHWRWDDLFVRLLYFHHDYAISSFLYIHFLVLQYGLELMSCTCITPILSSPLLTHLPSSV